MTLILIGIALIILFPIWPLSLKKIIFYISVVLLFVLVGIIIVRTFVYFLIRVFGYDFYIFPNLFAVQIHSLNKLILNFKNILGCRIL